jgi:V-type H+-transporting ATPase subunit C
VREFNYSAADIKSEKEQQTSLSTEKSKTYPVLFKWLKVNFSEAFSAWLHIKVKRSISASLKNLFQALRIFVESVLRYGLPVNFRAAVLIPSKPRKLRERLNKVFQ